MLLFSLRLPAEADLPGSKLQKAPCHAGSSSSGLLARSPAHLKGTVDALAAVT
jgi:hypothetical protein